MIKGNEGIIQYNLPTPPGERKRSEEVLPIDTFGGAGVSIGRTFKLSFSLKDQIDQSPTPKKQAALIQPQYKLVVAPLFSGVDSG